jgi:outer membrane protein assembly complex protein YaeT
MSTLIHRALRGCAFAAAACLTLSAPGRATAQQPERRPVAAIDVRAPEALLAPARDAVSVRVGAPFDIADLRRTMQNIYALGRVSDVQVNTRETPEGVRVEFVVLPAMHIASLRFQGDSPVRRSVLHNALTATTGDRITRSLLEEQAARVQGTLADRGYQGAVVEPELVVSDNEVEGTVVFHLRPGEATRLARLDFIGALGISEAETREAFGLREGGVFRYDLLGESIERLRRRLAENRFFYAEISIADQASNQSANTADLTLRVDAGPPVELQFRGWNRSEEELRRMLPFFEAASVADWILNQARADVIAELQRQGYWKPLVSFGRVRDDQGRNVAVTFTVAPVRRADVERVEIAGSEAIQADVLLGLVQTRERRLLRGAPFITSVWQQDQRAVLAHYRRNGFLQARVVEAPVTRDQELGGLRASMIIDEGERTVVNQMIIATRGRLSDYGVDDSGWAGALRTRSGGPFDPEAVRQDGTRLRILLANQGFPRAQVLSEVEETDDPYSVGVSFSIFPGNRVRVGQLLISGNERVRQEVIRRELSLVPGSPLTHESMILSQSRLYQLGLFSRVDIDTARPDSTETEPTIVVRVAEGSTQRLSWGVGYSTEEQVRGLLVFGQDNLWGRNHRATASVRASFAEQRVRFVYTNPYLLGRSVEGSLVGYYESVDEEGFKVQRIGTSLQLVKRHSDSLTSIGRYSFRDQQAFDILIDDDELEPEDRDALVGSVIYSLLADTRPNPIDPRGGRYHTIDTEWAARGLGSESDFVRLFGRSYWYWELPNNGVLVAAARAGLAVPYGGSIVPLPERFFAGGSSTLRGFGRNQAGPTDQTGNPLGGDVLLIGNVEYRFPLRSNLGAVIFADIGNVFADPESVSLSEVRETFGFGVRYTTPIGPLRLDWGHLLDARTGEDSSRLHFAIGQAF